MEIEILGSGAAGGIPLYGCDCSGCLAAMADPRLGREPCSAVIRLDNKQYLIDAGRTDLHQIFSAGSLDAICLTHFHPDHVQGLFHLRWGKNIAVDVFCPPDEEGCADLFKHPGILDFQACEAFTPIPQLPHTWIPLPLRHSKVTHGYYVQEGSASLAYLTDTKGLPLKTEQFLIEHPVDLLVIDCSFPPAFKGKGHNSLDEVLDIQARVNAKRVLLTHIAHDLNRMFREKLIDLPGHIALAEDGMIIRL